MSEQNYAVVISEGEEQEIKFYETEVAGSIPVEHDIPNHDAETQVVSLKNHEVQENKVVARYRVEQKPRRQQKMTFDEFADKVADRVIAKWQE